MRDTGAKSDDPHFSRLFPLISLLIVLVTIALHFGLVNEGHWAIDEFLVVRTYKDSGWEAFADRLMEWSPRPISEALTLTTDNYSYGVFARFSGTFRAASR
jgi:hypothetical protein